MPIYGSKEKAPINWYHEARNAVLYSNIERLVEIAKDHPEDVLLAAREGGAVDPYIIALHCEELRTQVVQYVAELEHADDKLMQQQPETILALAKLPGVNPETLFSALLSSCITFSFQAILGAIGTFDIKKIEEFIIEKALNNGSCKSLQDLAMYYTDYDRGQWAALFIQHDDIYGATTMANEGKLDHSDIDNALMAVVAQHATDVHSGEFQVAIENLFRFVEVAQDKANLMRIEDFLIDADRALQGQEEQLDKILIQFVRLVPTRDAVRDYMTVKRVMQS